MNPIPVHTAAFIIIVLSNNKIQFSVVYDMTHMSVTAEIQLYAPGYKVFETFDKVSSIIANTVQL